MNGNHSEKSMNLPMKTPIDDLIKQALEHYGRLSKECCDWNSLVPKAIREYGELEKLRQWRDEAAFPSCETCPLDIDDPKLLNPPSTCYIARHWAQSKCPKDIWAKQAFGGGAEKK